MELIMKGERMNIIFYYAVHRWGEIYTKKKNRSNQRKVNLIKRSVKDQYQGEKIE